MAKIAAVENTNAKNQVTVTFNVAVPSETENYHRSVFLAGNLHQLNSHWPDWDPDGIEMSQHDENHWTITLTGPENATVEYKYVLGSWDHVEKDARCGEIGNRRVTLTKTPTELEVVNDSVQAWRNEGQCGT